MRLLLGILLGLAMGLPLGILSCVSLPHHGAPPADAPTIVTPKWRIPIYIVGTPELPDLELVAKYFDLAESALRRMGVAVPISRVFLWAEGTLYFDFDRDGKRDEALGLAILGRPELGLSVVWTRRWGAWPYAHERLHQHGLRHDDIDSTTIDEQAAWAAIEGTGLAGARRDKEDTKKGVR